MKQVQRFKCNYCNKLTAKAVTMERHEKECIHNPNSINCFRCEFACMDDYEKYNGWDDSTSTMHDVPQCAYTEDKIEKNNASSCSKFRRSDKLIYDRTYSEAEKNYERVYLGRDKDAEGN